MVSRPIICGDGRDDLRRQVTQLLVIDRTALCPPIIWCTRDREATITVNQRVKRRICSERINSLVKGCLPWMITGYLLL